ncbi:MAG: DUF305 domain-containing protein [Nocardioides sp.]
MTSTTAQHAFAWRRRAAVVVALIATTAISACGSSDDAVDPGAVSTAANGSTFNTADVDFATEMIAHHAQAVQMVVVAQGRELDPAVAALMDEIRSAQVPEIETMVDWLTAWDEPIPETSLDHSNAGHDMGDMSSNMSDMSDMPGMMSADQMGALEDSTGERFQSMWLERMISHHEGAIQMAELEVENGTNTDAVALAQNLVTSQTVQIETMVGLLQ